MLQAQLNPHFLCNTLDTMKWISKINQVPQVALMSTDLADILRFCISPDEFVPLRREVEILRRKATWRSDPSACRASAAWRWTCPRSWRSAGCPR